MHLQWALGTCMSSYDPLTAANVTSRRLNPCPDVSSGSIILEFSLWQKNMFPPQLSQAEAGQYFVTVQPMYSTVQMQVLISGEEFLASEFLNLGQHQRKINSA